MRTANLVAGIVLFLIFLGSGVYMLVELQPLMESDATFRMAVRANHIYILLFALLNLMAINSGDDAQRSPGLVIFSRFARVLLLAGGVLVVIAFFYDLGRPVQARVLALPAMLLVLFGTVFYVLAEIRVAFRK